MIGGAVGEHVEAAFCLTGWMNGLLRMSPGAVGEHAWAALLQMAARWTSVKRSVCTMISSRILVGRVIKISDAGRDMFFRQGFCGAMGSVRLSWVPCYK